MKTLLPTLAFALATAAFGISGTASAQNAPDSPWHTQATGPMSHDGSQSGGMGHGAMPNGDMHNGGMDHGDRHGSDMNPGDDRGNMGGHHGWHRHCSMVWRHHHHVRVCR